MTAGGESLGSGMCRKSMCVFAEQTDHNIRPPPPFQPTDKLIKLQYNTCTNNNDHNILMGIPSACPPECK